jgi:hypothetical protein
MRGELLEQIKAFAKSRVEFLWRKFKTTGDLNKIFHENVTLSSFDLCDPGSRTTETIGKLPLCEA